MIQAGVSIFHVPVVEDKAGEVGQTTQTTPRVFTGIASCSLLFSPREVQPVYFPTSVPAHQT